MFSASAVSGNFSSQLTSLFNVDLFTPSTSLLDLTFAPHYLGVNLTGIQAAGQVHKHGEFLKE